MVTCFFFVFLNGNTHIRIKNLVTANLSLLRPGDLLEVEGAEDQGFLSWRVTVDGQLIWLS